MQVETDSTLRVLKQERPPNNDSAFKVTSKINLILGESTPQCLSPYNQYQGQIVDGFY